MTPLQSLLQKRRRAFRTRLHNLVGQTRLRRTLTACFSVGIIMLAVGYVVVVNSVSTKGLHISDLHRQVLELRERHTQMALQIDDLQSLDHLETTLPQDTYEKVAQVEYIRSATPAVASR